MRSRVELRVLGPLEVWHAGASVSLGGPRQRAVLAALLVRANDVVTAQYLTEVVWETPPASPESNIRTYVAGLRQRLHQAGADGSRLVTEAGGYLFRVFPGELDMQTFSQLIDRARQAQDEAELARAAECYQQALGLWRGNPLDGLPVGARLWAELARLEERHLSAVEQHATTRMALGEHDGVIGELRRLVLQHPFRENLWSRLMLALSGAGRPAEALQAFQDARRVLRDELGAEPGRELQDLHQRILRQEAVAPPPVPRAAPPAGPVTVPRQLPADVRGFAARAAELARLDAILASTGEHGTAVPVCVVSGTAGVGKTALAVHWAHRVSDRFPDGQLYVNLRGFDPTGATMSPAEAVRGFLDALAVRPDRIPASPEAQIGLYRSLLADRRMLVVLDNARDIEQVRPLLPGAPGSLVLVTSRNHLTGLVAAEGAHPVTLDLLTVADAREMLARRLGTDRVTGEPQAVDEIIASCARLPLALAVAGARADTHPGFPLGALARELRDVRAGLDVFVIGDAATDVRAILSWSYRTLSPAAARLFRLLGLHPGPDTAAPAAASLAGLPPHRVRLLLAELARAHLVVEHAPGRYSFHDLLRAYAAELAVEWDSEPDRRAAVRRVLDHYLHTARDACRLLDPHRELLTVEPAESGVDCQPLADRAEARLWLAAEHSVLLATIARAASGGFDTHAWRLAWILVDHLDYGGRYHDLAVTHLTALEAARRLGDRRAEGYAQRGLGGAYAQLGQLGQAETHYCLALDLYAELEDPVGQAFVQLGLGRVLARQARYAEARDHAEQAFELNRAALNRIGQARALNGVGWYEAQLGNYRKALVHCQQALLLQRALADRRGEANTLHSLGYAHQHLGSHQHAVACYQEARELFAGFGDQYNVADTLGYLGDAHDAAGDAGAAGDAWRQALDIFVEIGHSDAERIRARLSRLRAGYVETDGMPAAGR
ncbi:SARP family transcriptional regulator [Plantactinospora mayteni]|uniref:SARP family transcriptional regulator n=1 Tax=Plantactinospora mayteni TaxID=566021 RepID=A0ABQ4EID6_9ACTN|nr:SARP family transcriptional regulator [Plantactinospora mayteni]